MDEPCEIVEPNWELLPYSPARFFDLPDGYDRQELKRRYNALIRRFKPERCPDEFQRIRTAFEELDNRLRYEAHLSPEYDQHFEWQASPHPPEQHRDTRPTSSRSPSKELLDWLKYESPQAIFERLQRQAAKSPFDFYALAVLSEVSTPQEPLSFSKWLLKGLTEHPNEPGLLHVLFVFLRTKLPAESLPGILRAVARIVNNDRFYFLTEPVWERLLESQAFEEVRQLLADCERELRDHRLSGKLTFYIYFLRRAVWLADDAWLAEAFSLVLDNSAELRGRFDMDLDLLELLRDYRASRRQFLNGTEARHLIDAAIRDFCLRNGYSADQAVLECQLELAQRPELIREAFSSLEVGSRAWFTLWNRISADVAERLADQSDRLQIKRLWDQLRVVLMRATQTTSSSIMGAAWLSIDLGLLGLILLTIGSITAITSGIVFFVLQLSGVTISRAQPSPAVLAVAGSLMSAIVIFTKLLNRQFFDPLRIRVAHGIANRCYRQQWRPLLEQHLSLTHQPFDLLLDHLFMAQKNYSAPYIPWILQHARSDYALACLAISQRFMR